MARLNTLWTKIQLFQLSIDLCISIGGLLTIHILYVVFRSVFRFLTFLQVFRRCSSGFSSISSLDSLSKSQEYYCTQSQIFCLHSSVAILIEKTWAELYKMNVKLRLLCFDRKFHRTRALKILFSYCQLLSQLKL